MRTAGTTPAAPFVGAVTTRPKAAFSSLTARANPLTHLSVSRNPQTLARIAVSQSGERDWRERLRLAFRAFMWEVESEPQAARLALVETFAAGPASLEGARCAENLFEAMVAESISRAPDEFKMPPLLVKGIVTGAARVARARLIAGREQEARALA